MKLIKICVIVFVLPTFNSFISAQDYCQFKCKNGQPLGCSNKNGAFASVCTNNARIEPMTQSLRQIILNEHNLLRNQIAQGAYGIYSAAARMATLQWDAELTKLAELNAKQCILKHDVCRRNSQGQPFGQNLALNQWAGQVKLVPVQAREDINSWFSENKDASMMHINKYSELTNGKLIGHFAQLIQDKATHVGCSILRQTKNGLEEMYLACDYSYPNWNNEAVYESGVAASKCQTGINPSYQFLCSVYEKY